MKETYYDMLANSQKPFNLKKGHFVKPDVLDRMKLHQAYRCVVPTDSQVNPVREHNIINRDIEREQKSCKSSIGSQGSIKSKERLESIDFKV